MNIDLVFMFYQLLHIVIIISQRISPIAMIKKNARQLQQCTL